MKITITQPLHIEKVKDVYLNRGGKRIGYIGWLYSRGRRILVYVSPRRIDHFFRKAVGFGIDKPLLKKLFWGDYNEAGCKVEKIVIRYEGVRGCRYFISNVEDWYDHAEVGEYPKAFSDRIETYGTQAFLNKNVMCEMELKMVSL